MSTFQLIRTLLFTLALSITLLKHTSAQKQRQTGLLWEISGKEMTSPAYLFGTIYLYNTSVYELPQAPFEILDKTRKVYFERDFGVGVHYCNI
ncbi:TraB/GumN family protein [Chitinophaga rhizophila]|uniref:Uncharacterized protein n=1 Tax=Chitinophaga rhizophila TaxID=2866212 RepID=A0ABS7GD46_9BACT|nr:hypothetical protein [Chitinophaga rhizophila]MBW8684734.1 hypothetical protein [Chitinophaga rhizophila]